MAYGELSLEGLGEDRLERLVEARSRGGAAEPPDLRPLQRREQRRILELFGTVDHDPDYDYKKQRARA